MLDTSERQPDHLRSERCETRRPSTRGCIVPLVAALTILATVAVVASLVRNGLAHGAARVGQAASCALSCRHRSCSSCRNLIRATLCGPSESAAMGLMRRRGSFNSANVSSSLPGPRPCEIPVSNLHVDCPLVVPRVREICMRKRGNGPRSTDKCSSGRGQALPTWCVTVCINMSQCRWPLDPSSAASAGCSCAE